MKLNYLQAFERVKIEEYKNYYIQKGYTIIEDDKFDLILKKDEITLVFEFKTGSHHIQSIEILKEEAESKYPGSHFEIVFCLPKQEIKNSIKIDWLKDYLDYFIRKERLKEIQDKVNNFSRISDLSIDIHTLNWENNEILISGIGYLLFWVKANTDNVVGEILTDPLIFEYNIKVKSSGNLESTIIETELVLKYEKL